MLSKINALRHWPCNKLHHHAMKLEDERFYHVFLVDEHRKTFANEGDRKEAMRQAFVECMKWLETFIDSPRATFTVISNAVEIASVCVGEVEFIDARHVEQLNEVEALDIA